MKFFIASGPVLRSDHYEPLLLCKISKDGWMDDMQFYVLFNSISVISGLQKVDNESLCAVELHLWLRRFRLERVSNSVR